VRVAEWVVLYAYRQSPSSYARVISDKTIIISKDPKSELLKVKTDLDLLGH
jgi:hypothetical protein